MVDIVPKLGLRSLIGWRKGPFVDENPYGSDRTVAKALKRPKRILLHQGFQQVLVSFGSCV